MTVTELQPRQSCTVTRAVLLPVIVSDSLAPGLPHIFLLQTRLSSAGLWWGPYISITDPARIGGSVVCGLWREERSLASMPGGAEPKAKRRRRTDKREKEKPLLAVQVGDRLSVALAS